MKNEKEMIIKAIESNCRLLNDALESELRKIHNDCPVIVNERCIELIDMTIQYTKMYMKLQHEIMVGALHKSICLDVDEQEKIATAATAAENNFCHICGEQNATLQNINGSFICDDCAQHMSDYGHELSLRD